MTEKVKHMKKFALILISLFIAACSDESKLDGTYGSHYHTYSFTFKPDGTGSINSSGKKIGDYKYKISGGKITLLDRVAQLTVVNENEIDGGVTYGKLVKK